MHKFSNSFIVHGSTVLLILVTALSYYGRSYLSDLVDLVHDTISVYLSHTQNDSSVLNLHALKFCIQMGNLHISRNHLPYPTFPYLLTKGAQCTVHRDPKKLLRYRPRSQSCVSRYERSGSVHLNGVRRLGGQCAVSWHRTTVSLHLEPGWKPLTVTGDLVGQGLAKTAGSRCSGNSLGNLPGHGAGEIKMRFSRY